MSATIIFYLLGVITVVATLLAIFQRNPVHAVIYLVNSFIALALLFFLLGAPLVAAWEIIIYAGAIMVLFMFIIMMLELGPGSDMRAATPGWRQRLPVLMLGLALAVCTLLLIGIDTTGGEGVPRWHASPREFGYALFTEFALAVKIISFQLSFAAAGAYYIGRPKKDTSAEEEAS
jgi:NADH-quinone oxidoreductase subunit J